MNLRCMNSVVSDGTTSVRINKGSVVDEVSLWKDTRKMY